MQTEPTLPAVIISAVNISNSKFLGPLALELNPQYNAIIGGRGTGKSTILEYIRWALCDSSPDALDDDGETVNYQAKQRVLVEKTLANYTASVQVSFVIRGVPHVVRRDASTQETLLKIGSEVLRTCSEADIRNLLPIQAYSQKQLSSVGVRVEELKRFIRVPVRRRLEQVEKQIRDVALEVRMEYARLGRFRRTQRELANNALELESAGAQVRHTRESFQGVDQADQQIIDLRGAVDDADQVVSAWREEITHVRGTLAELRRAVEGAPSPLSPSIGSVPRRDRLEALYNQLVAIFGDVGRMAGDLGERIGELESERSRFGAALREWDQERRRFEAEYEGANLRSGAQEATLRQLADLEGRARMLRERMGVIQAEATAMQDAQSKYNSLRARWLELHVERASVLDSQCDEFTRLSDGLIRARLDRHAEVKQVIDKFRVMATGAGIRLNRFEKLTDVIASSENRLTAWETVLTELQDLAGDQPAESTIRASAYPTLAAAGLTDGDLTKITRKLTTELWLDLSLTSIDDRPVFEYQLREADYIPFSDASAGQQATALLGVLLSQDGPPLIIDQPEDDLDNQVIVKVVDQIWNAKSRRQLLFASHNANLVVNGDAELVVCCGYRVTGEQASGEVKCQGAIDMDDVRAEIATVMEGGQEAFQLRRAKYGF